MVNKQNFKENSKQAIKQIMRHLLLLLLLLYVYKRIKTVPHMKFFQKETPLSKYGFSFMQTTLFFIGLPIRRIGKMLHS